MIRTPSSLAPAIALAALATAARADAGTFDPTGAYIAAPDAAAHLDFSTPPTRWLPADVSKRCGPEAYELVTTDDALDGTSLLHIATKRGCEERFVLDLPATSAQYRATLWMRHGVLRARLVVDYPAATGLGSLDARLFPTGRATSDGWVELASNELPIQAIEGRLVSLQISDFGGANGTDVDALEVTRAGDFEPRKSCAGHEDDACGDEGACEYGTCKLGRLTVPTLPPDGLRDDMVDMFESRLRLFFGGQLSRERYLPDAIARLEASRSAKTAWQFWNGWAWAVRELHDAHTSAGGAFGRRSPTRRINACFVEGDADLTQATWPKDVRYLDLLVSHAGADGAAGLKAGDRLVAVDGQHPLDWARSLIDVDWGHHVATDPDVFAEHAEKLGGPYWAGGALIARYASTMTVLRCDASGCASVPETIDVQGLGYDGTSPDIACDNRPAYHIDAEKKPDPATHYVYGDFFRGPITGTQPEEAIFGMVWDTLYGGGDPDGWVNGNILSAIDDWKQNARGVILDHRAGNGGTLDAAEYVTSFVRDPKTIAIVRMPMQIGGFDGPSDDAEGLALFLKYRLTLGYDVGSATNDAALPVALLIHRDVSASDYMPFGMKGAPHVRIFGPHATAGAFSTFVNLEYYGDLSYQIASGETIAYDGRALIGHGVLPDEIVQQKQSDLVLGKDTIHEAALAWVREELKP